MTDFEVANQVTDVMAMFFEGFGVLATLIFAYVTGAFYFLHRAPVFTKVVSFAFLSFAVTFLMINVLGAYFHFTALIDQVERQVADGATSPIILAIQNGRTRLMTEAGLWTFAPVIIGTMIMCFWMTFIWTPDEPEVPPEIVDS